MKIMHNLYIPICGFLCALLLIICFFTKERVKNMETKLFSGMLITSFLDSVFMILIILIAYVSKDSIVVLKVLNKLDYLQFLLWIWLFFLYIIYIAYKDNQIIYKHYSNIFKLTGIINIIIIFVLFMVPVYLYNTNNVMYSYGPSCNVLYMTSAIYIVLILFTLIVNLKKIVSKKYLPFYIFAVFAIIVLIMKKVNPGLVIITAVLAYVDLIMYFAIENPDVKMLNQMELAKNEAEKANSAKTDFLSSMSHEIRTPLNAIVGFSECIKNTDDINEAHEDAEDVIKASKTLLEIVNGILDISKIEAGKLEIINSPYDSKELLTQVAKLIKPKMEEKALDFKVSIADDIPKTLYGDHANIKKIITNLLSNAAKYTEKGFVKYEVRCINNKNVCRLVISIEDSGRGIKEENMNKLFTKFQRLEEDRNTTLEGTGLGLAITKQLVELMGGKIVVQSVYGSGSKFTIILDQRIEKVEIKEQKEDLNIKIDLTGKKILIVDDNLLNIKVASKLLEKYHPTIDTCDNGYTCIEKIKNNEKYDLILLDDMMPKLSGAETLKELKSINGFNITTIALTANAITGMREKYLNDGFDNYLAKPINKEELKKLLIKYLVNNDKTIDFGELPKEMYEIGNTDEIDIAQPVNSKNKEIEYEYQEENENKKEAKTSSIDYLKENHIDIDKSISLLGDIDTYNDTLKDFLNNISNRIKKLSEYKDNDDMENYSIEIHSLKSDSKYLGFTALAGICFEQELKSKENNSKYIKDDYSKMIKELDKMIDISNKYLNM